MSMSDSVIKMLEKKEFIEKKFLIFNHNFAEMNKMITFCFFMALPLISLIIGSIFYDGEKEFLETGLGFILGCTCGISILITMILIMDSLSYDAKIIKNKYNYLEKNFSAKDLSYMFTLFPELKSARIEEFKTILTEEKDRIETEFEEKANLKKMHTLLLKNSISKEKHFLFFKRKVKEFNKKSEKERNFMKEINKEMDKIGFSNFDVPNNKLSLSIEEE